VNLVTLIITWKIIPIAELFWAKMLLRKSGLLYCSG
jgi:hypothetical protein